MQAQKLPGYVKMSGSAASWLLLTLCLRASCLAQEYEEYYGEYFADEARGPTMFQKIMTSPFASLLLVLIGSAGLFNLFFTGGRVERTERQTLVGLMCVGAVIAMCWYRFSLWNDPQFNAKP